jgi:hypothetical protein
MNAPTTSIARTHSERYTSLATGKTIIVACGCAIGHEHVYADWVAMTEDKRRPAPKAA